MHIPGVCVCVCLRARACPPKSKSLPSNLAGCPIIWGGRGFGQQTTSQMCFAVTQTKRRIPRQDQSQLPALPCAKALRAGPLRTRANLKKQMRLRCVPWDCDASSGVLLSQLPSRLRTATPIPFHQTYISGALAISAWKLTSQSKDATLCAPELAGTARGLANLAEPTSALCQPPLRQER